MDKEQFKEFCKNDFKSRGFKKVKNMFYLPGQELMCGLCLQKSNYGPIYYVNYYYFIGDFRNTNKYPTQYEFDIYGRIYVMSKRMEKGTYSMTAMIEYGDYTEEDLKPYFDKAFEEILMPPLHFGKKYILDNLGKKYRLSLRQEEVMQKLQS